MDTIKNIGFKEAIVAAVFGWFLYKLVEWCRGGEAKVKNSQAVDQDLKGPDLRNRLVSSENAVSPVLIKSDGVGNVSDDIGGKEALNEQNPQKEKLGSSTEFSESPSKMQLQVEKKANQNQVEVDLSFLESQLTEYNIRTDTEGGIRITLYDSKRDNLQIVMNVLKHPGYAHKLSQIQDIYFGYGFSFYGYEDSIQEFIDMFGQFPNLSTVTFHEVCDQLVTELHPNYLSVQIAAGSNLKEYTFCKGKIKLDMETIPNIKSFACWNDSFHYNYLVERKETKESLARGKSESDRIVATSCNRDAMHDPDCPSHRWLLNDNLVIMWFLLKKDEAFNAIPTVAAPGITVREWAEIMEHPLHDEIQTYRNLPSIGGMIGQNREEELKQKRIEWEALAWDREKEEMKKKEEIEKEEIKRYFERKEQEKAERDRVEWEKIQRIKAAHIRNVREKREKETAEKVAQTSVDQK